MSLFAAFGNFLNCTKEPRKRKGYDIGMQLPSKGSPHRELRRASLHELPSRNGSTRIAEELEPMIGQFDYKEPQGPDKACILCCACCGCLSAALVALVVLLAFVVGTANVEVENTSFTFWNYCIPQFRYLLAGQADTVSWSRWYEGLASEEAPMVGRGPGPNTVTYYSWHEVKERLEDFVERIRAGTVRRHNELGMTIMSDALWPDTGTVVTGFPNGDHGVIRPYLASSLDGAEGPWDKNCDGSSCWNEAWLCKVFKERFAGLDSFTREDLVWIVGAVLHKVHLNLDVSDEMIKDFAVLQQELVKAAPFSRNWFWEMVLGSQRVLTDKEELKRLYKDAIKAKWPEEPWDRNPQKLNVLASAVLDSLTLIGTAAASTSLDFLLSIMYMAGEPGRSIRPLDFDDRAQLSNFIWETLRRYPPVQAVPRWVSSDDDRGGEETAWKHEILSLYQALHDPNVFPEPLEYRLGRPGLNHIDGTLSLAWADVAMANGDVAHPNSHACPAKQLSFRIILSFLKEFDAAGPWQADNPDIVLNSYGSSSGFTLRKKRAVLRRS